MTAAVTTAPFVTRIPARLFASVMGLAGLALAWRAAAEILPVPGWIGEALGALSLAVFVILAAGYLAKLIQAPAAVRAEFDDPVQGSFLATISVSLLLLGGVLRPWAFGLADFFWLTGAASQLLLAIAVCIRWLSRRPAIRQVNPGWFIPTIGNIVAPITGTPLGHIELGWFFFAVGLAFTLILYPLVCYRLLRHERLPPPLQPTLFILIVPPAIIALAWLALGRGFDAVVHGGVIAALAVALLLAARLRQFAALPFAASWWAYTFPLDALTVASLRYHEGLGAGFSAALAIGLLSTTTVVVSMVMARTLLALKDGTLLPAASPLPVHKAAA